MVAAAHDQQPAASRPVPYIALALALVVGLVAILSISSHSLSSALVPGLINAIAATGLGFLARQSGLISFGHAVHFGLGAYSVVLIGNSGLVPFELAMLAGMLIPPLLMLVIGPVLMRAEGSSFPC